MYIWFNIGGSINCPAFPHKLWQIKGACVFGIKKGFDPLFYCLNEKWVAPPIEYHQMMFKLRRLFVFQVIPEDGLDAPNGV
jgi:hypothetical protein